jgi:hypothetical protein
MISFRHEIISIARRQTIGHGREAHSVKISFINVFS